MKKSVGKTKVDQGDAMPVAAGEAPARLFVNVVLEGDEVTQFLDYKKSKFLRSKSEVGRSLILERLNQLSPAA